MVVTIEHMNPWQRCLGWIESNTLDRIKKVQNTMLTVSHMQSDKRVHTFVKIVGGGSGRARRGRGWLVVGRGTRGVVLTVVVAQEV